MKSFNLAEADRVVVFFTRDHGVVRGVAKGAKRLKSRFGSTLEPFSTVRLSYFQKEDRELVSIQEAELVRSAFDIAADPAFLHTYSYIADLLLAFAPPHDPNETLYRMLQACISARPSSPEALLATRLYFELWLLRLGGYLPDWGNCDECGRSLNDVNEAGLQANFHLLCPNCRRSRGAVTVSGSGRSIFRDIQRAAPAEFIANADEMAAANEELSAILRRILSQILGREVAAGLFPEIDTKVEKNAA